MLLLLDPHIATSIRPRLGAWSFPRVSVQAAAAEAAHRSFDPETPRGDLLGCFSAVPVIQYWQSWPILVSSTVPVCKRKNSRRTEARMFEKRRCGREVRDGDHRALSLSFSLYFSISFSPPQLCSVWYPYDVTHPGPRSTATRHSYRHDHDCPPCPGKCKFSQSQDAYRSSPRLCSWNQAP